MYGVGLAVNGTWLVNSMKFVSGGLFCGGYFNKRTLIYNPILSLIALSPSTHCADQVQPERVDGVFFFSLKRTNAARAIR